MTRKNILWITAFMLCASINVDATPLDNVIDSANRGNIQAQTQLGVMLATGNGSNIDLEEAKKWLRKAAHGGSVDAEYNLGVIYSDLVDYSHAYYWFEKAANNGNRDAQYNLAVIYSEGLGVKQNLAEAEMWFQKSIENGTPEDQFEFALLYKDGIKLPKDFKKAHYWFEKAASDGHMMAQYEVGRMYGEGIGVKQNYAKSVDWLYRSALQGNNIAAYEIEVVARRGLGWESIPVVNSAVISNETGEQLSNDEAAKNLFDLKIDELIEPVEVTADIMDEESILHEQPIEVPEVITIDRCDVFSKPEDNLNPQDLDKDVKNEEISQDKVEILRHESDTDLIENNHDDITPDEISYSINYAAPAISF